MCDGSNEPSGTVELPAHLLDTVEDRLAHTRFDSVDEYVAVALELLLSELERSAAGADGESDAGDPGRPSGETSGRDREPDGRGDEAVRRQLESLGYL